MTLDELIILAWQKGRRTCAEIVAYAQEHHDQIVAYQSIASRMSAMRAERRLPKRQKKKKPSFYDKENQE